MRSSSDKPVVTYTLIALCLVVYALQWVIGESVTNALMYYAPFTILEPWRMITAAFVHSPTNILHVAFNMFSLFIFGPILEQLVGRIRFLVLYLLAALGGSVAVLLLAPGVPVLGASGAIFGLFGAFFIIQRKLGGNSVQLLIVIGLNLAIGFFIPNISWQGHVGGLIAGSAVAFAYVQTRRPNQTKWQIALVGAIVVSLLVLTAVGVTALY